MYYGVTEREGGIVTDPDVQEVPNTFVGGTPEENYHAALGWQDRQREEALFSLIREIGKQLNPHGVITIGRMLINAGYIAKISFHNEILLTYWNGEQQTFYPGSAEYQDIMKLFGPFLGKP